MGAALLKQEFAAVLGGPLDWQSRPAPETMETGIPDLRLPRGCLTEIYGAASSGRTTLLYSILAAATARDELCALVDGDDSFDPASAEAAGVRLENILWISCGKNCGNHCEILMKSTDLLVQGGGFGVVVMDLGETPPQTARRISLTSWFRLRRAVENTPTVLISLARQQNAKTCASLAIECRRERAVWCGRLFRGMRLRATATERRKACSPVFTAKAI